MPIYRFQVAGDRGSTFQVKDDESAAMRAADRMAESYRGSVSVYVGGLGASRFVGRATPPAFRALSRRDDNDDQYTTSERGVE